MSLEQSINEYLGIIDRHLFLLRYPRYLGNIERWDWRGYPYTNAIQTNMDICPEGHVLVNTALEHIHTAITDADTNECLTSPARYIREYKKYLKGHYGQCNRSK